MSVVVDGDYENVVEMVMIVAVGLHFAAVAVLVMNVALLVRHNLNKVVR